MKHRIIALLTVILMLCLSLTSCGDTEPEKNIVYDYNFDGSMAYTVCDLNNIEAITETSTQIIKCKINSLDQIKYESGSSFNFVYSIEVLDIYLDIGDRLEIGDIIPVMSSEGLVKASEAAKSVKNSSQAKKINLLQGEYTDNDYLRSSKWDGIPIEVGKTYYMYLTDRYMEGYDIYVESGRQFMYEISGNKIYNGRERVKNDLSADKVLKAIKAQIELRTGRCDEIGFNAYTDELGEIQAKERKLAKNQQ